MLIRVELTSAGFYLKKNKQQEQDQNGPTSLAPSVASRYQDGSSTPTTDAEHLTPLPSLLNGDMSQSATLELPKVAPPVIHLPSVTPQPEIIQVCYTGPLTRNLARRLVTTQF